MKFYSILFVFCLFCPSFSYAKGGFHTGYLLFEIKNGFKCKPFGDFHWICHHRLSKPARPAFIFITATKILKKDTASMYYDGFLESVSFLFEKQMGSTVTINSYDWEQGLFYFKDGSFFSRFAGLLCCPELKEKEKFHIFIGFNSHSSVYPEYSTYFLKAILSLQITNIESFVKRFKNVEMSEEDYAQMRDYIQKVMEGEDELIWHDMKKEKRDWGFYGIFFLMVLLVITLIYMAYIIAKNYFIQKRRWERRVRLKRRLRRRKK